jgi:hypothetical protein
MRSRVERAIRDHLLPAFHDDPLHFVRQCGEKRAEGLIRIDVEAFAPESMVTSNMPSITAGHFLAVTRRELLPDLPDYAPSLVHVVIICQSGCPA